MKNKRVKKAKKQQWQVLCHGGGCQRLRYASNYDGKTVRCTGCGGTNFEVITKDFSDKKVA